MSKHQFTVLYSIGHSDRPIETFIALLKQHAIETLVDVRAMPYSKHHPPFQQSSLRDKLEAAGIVYHWAGVQLGGRRVARTDSPHLGLAEAKRGYADYMESEEFARAATKLARLAKLAPTAMMCAERLPENCHRSMIADYLLLQGLRIVHLIDADTIEEHQLNPAARRESQALIYDRQVTPSLEF